jgi:hypothetical protein
MSSDTTSEEEKLIVGGREALDDHLDCSIIYEWAEGNLTGTARTTAKAALGIVSDSQAQQMAAMKHVGDIWDGYDH